MTDLRRPVAHALSHRRVPSFIFTSTDYWRWPLRNNTSVGYKEWSHFCAFADGLLIVVNFSLIGQGSPRDGRAREVPRIVMITRHDGIWDGDLVQFSAEDVQIGEGSTDLTIGGNSVGFADDSYYVDVALASSALRARLCLHPLARPAIASSVRLSADERMRWLVVPRLVAEGKITIGGEEFNLDRAPAYHDRNWGHFRWGADYSWEWATILPTSLSVPWSLVYMRISDASRNRTYSQSLMVWRDARSARVFHGADLHVTLSGLLKQRRTFRLPHIVNLMVPAEGSSIPRNVDIGARAWSDRLDLHISLEDFAQVGVPNDGPDGLTLLSQVAGEAEVSGRIDGENVGFQGHVLAEFNHAAH